MQIQTWPLIPNERPPIISEYAETKNNEDNIVSISAQNGGQHVILGDNLTAEDQAEKVIYAVASNGQLLISNLPPQ